ncbi:MAG: choice-of-anchor J domain-containing protein [Candidatus Thermoplasmatota archaeon]|jgi:hypothetical protein|nr:choice-of-anchor J domain-containing protein [Candidatus Thermoplasmatota archaeon]
MIRKNMLKAAIVTLIALALIFPVTAMDTKTTPQSISKTNQSTQSRDIIFEDGFESYEDWLIEFPPWTCIDVNGDPTFGHSAYTWPHQYEPYAFIIFNPDTTTPPSTDAAMQPHTGEKYCAGFNDDNAGYTNDDWLITPQLAGTFDSVIFWARSFSDQYNLERFTVSVSTTDTDPASFTMISPDPYVIPPLEWTEYTYDISSYSGQAIYIGIHMVSVDSWYLEIDDFQVTGSAGDVTPPVTTATLEGEQSGDVYTTDVTVTLTATDSGSGVNSTMYKIDDGTYTLYTAPFVVNGNGEHTVAFYSTDLAGNIETEKSATFTIEYPLEVTVKGGMGVSITIKNIGSAPVTDVEWSITLFGGFSIKDKSLEGTILQIPADGTATKKLPVFGFGKTNISVVVNGVETTKSGFIFLFFVLGVK